MICGCWQKIFFSVEILNSIYEGYSAFPYWTIHTFAGACFACTAAPRIFKLWGIELSATQNGKKFILLSNSALLEFNVFWSSSGWSKRYKARWIFHVFLSSASNVPKLLRTAKIEINFANVGPHKTSFLYTKCSTEGSWLNLQSRIWCRTLFFIKPENIK